MLSIYFHLILQHKPCNWGKRLSLVSTINVRITKIIFEIILGVSNILSWLTTSHNDGEKYNSNNLEAFLN